MSCESFEASAPGSLMFAGEYAVLHGKQSIVMAIDKRITAKLTPRDDRKICVYSQDFGEYSTDLDDFHIAPNFAFVSTAIVADGGTACAFLLTFIC